MDPELLRKILRRYLPQFRQCYQQELITQNRKLEGVLSLDFRIGKRGRVIHSNIHLKDAHFSKHGTNCMNRVLSLIKFPKPRGGGFVDVTQPGQVIVFSYFGNKLYKYGEDIHQLCCIKLSSLARGLCVDDNDKVLMSVDNKVCVYGEDGKLLSVLTRQHTELKPCGVCVDKNCNVLLCDESSQSVLLFNKQHQFVRSLINVDHLPVRMTLFDNTHLAVCDYNSDTGSRALYVYRWSCLYKGC
jgi:hypothetical protein